ncbi:MAG: hypothetical protein R6X34_14445, partial [Chloroflexota bacterium]
LDNGDGSIVVENNTVSFTASPAMNVRDHAGIAVFRRDFYPEMGYVDIPNGVVVRSNTVSGYQQQNPASAESEGFGIVGEGTNHTITGNTITANDIGIQHQGGLHPTANYTANAAGNGEQADGASASYFGRGNAPYACDSTIDSNTFTGNGQDIRQSIINAGSGIVTNTDTSEAFCTIQAAIDDSDTLDGHTIQVDAGIFAESLNVYKELQLLGPNANIDPNTGARVAEAVLRPALISSAEATFYNVYVNAGNVTINGFTIDGDNPLVTTVGGDMNGANVDASYGIYAQNQDPNGPLTVSHNVIQNFDTWPFLGWTGSGAVSSGNVIANNKIDNNVDGRAIVPLWNYYADVLDNVITRTAVGIYSENTHLPSTQPSMWRNNTISATRSGIWYNLAYGTATPISIENNTISSEDNSLGTRWDGMWLTSLGSNLNPNILNNNITGAAITQQTNGYHMWNNTTTTPGGISIQGGSVTNVDFGVWINNWDGYPTVSGSNAGRSTATLSQLSISNSGNAAVYAKDNPLEPDGDPVIITVQDVDINGAPVSVLVEGADATAVIKGSSIDNVPTVFNLNGGVLTAYANNITNFTSGVSNSGGALNARHNWWGAIAPTGVNDTNAYDYRLGAAVNNWGEGTLGSASLTTATGSGTGVIVSHGRGLANVPFGKGSDPYASAMCSDYYDFFVLNGSGDWTVSVPTDAGTECEQTRAHRALYQFTLTGDRPDTDCVGGACWWNEPTAVSLTGNNLEVTVAADAILQGTPFVAGDNTPLSNDPTAVSLSSFSHAKDGRWGITAVFIILLFTTAGPLLARRQSS